MRACVHGGVYTCLVAATLFWLFAPGDSCFAEKGVFAPVTAIRTVVRELQHKHVTRATLDDKLSRKWFHAFLDRLDPQRMYFLESDLRTFRRYEETLDDSATAGGFQFPELVRERYRERLSEATRWVTQLLAVEPEFTVDERCPAVFETYATTRQALRERWRLK